MNIIKEPLHIKILSGYLIVLAVIGCMAFIFLHERQRMQEMDRDLLAIRNIQNNINTAHLYITELAFDGETVVGWDMKDYDKYHAKRMHVDSLLQVLRIGCIDFVHPERVEKLRKLLTDKEEHLLHIMQIFQRQEDADSLLIHKLPSVASQATDIREIVKKKKGFAGFLGGKERIFIFPQTDKLHALNEQLITMMKEREYALAVQIDSLTERNLELNRQFMELVVGLGKQVQDTFADKEQQLSEMRKTSFHLIAYVLASAILLSLVSYFIIHRDIGRRIRERRKMEKIIEENKMLLEMRKNIILTVSHDIRGPLGNISNSAELAMDTREKRKRNIYLENIHISCRHILHLVNNLLDIYRMNERKDARNDVPFKLDSFIDRITTRYSRVGNDKGLLFTTVLSGLETTVKGDVDRIEQILDNLLVNAIKFTETGEICFTAGYGNGHLIVEVCDTGIGMSEETVSRIFIPFERAAQGVNSEGFGLGLSITKGLVGLLDGEISVKSSFGKGSVFRVILPLTETDEKEEKDYVSITDAIRLPRKVLVIDDDSVQLEVIKEMLERNGVSCEVCSNMKEVVQAFRTQNFDLVLTDIQMPGADGFSLLKLLRNSNIGNSRAVPVMAMTARGDRDISGFKQAGFLGCVYKSFSTKELLSFISTAVRQERNENNLTGFKALTSETNDKHKILELFIKETEKSIAELQGSLESMDPKQLRETVHRMLPLWELLQADEMLRVYRRMLHEEKADEETLWEETRRIIDYAHGLIAKARAEITESEHETEDTNS